MPRFKPYDYNQDAMVVINYKDQLQPGTFEHAVHYLVDNKLDLSVFYPKYKNDETGCPAYDPALLLKIILFAYSKGITSSREVQWCCKTNIIFMALSCQTAPHFTTLAEFVSRHPEQIESLFEQILLVCNEQGLLGNENAFFEGRVNQCRHRSLKNKCMRNPSSADHRKGKGRQVSFILKKSTKSPSYTDWMKERVDSVLGKHIYSHRMSVVGR